MHNQTAKPEQSVLGKPIGPMGAKPQSPKFRPDSRLQKPPLDPDALVGVALLGDTLVILASLAFGFWLRFKSGLITFGVEANISSFSEYTNLILVGAGFLLAAFAYLRVYEKQNLLRFRRVGLLMVKACTFWLFAYLGISLALKFSPPISRIYVLSSYLSCLAALLVWRWVFYQLLRTESIARSLRQRILFIGWNAEAERLAHSAKNDPNHPYEIIGCLPSSIGVFQVPPPAHIPKLGTYTALPQVLEQRAANIVVLADLNPHVSDIIRLANLCEKEFVQFKVIPSYFQIFVSGLHLEPLSGVPILGVSELPLERFANRIAKRCIDIIGASFGLLVSAPILAVCAFLIYLESPGSVFFAQERIGRKGQKFRMFKLRSMKLGADKTDHLNQSTLRQDPRLLKIGSFLRKWNLDEVPQFWNVLKGDMSLVGPRPERTFHSEKLSSEIPHYNARYSSKPGMTGWAQIHGLRGETDLVERVRYDLFYMENWNIWLDFQIMVQTFVRRENAY